MSQSVHFLANYAHNSEQIFSKRLNEIATKLNTKGFSWPPVLYPIANAGIKEIAVGSHHVAFLLQDGRVCRVGINVFCDKIDSGRSGSDIKSYAQKGSGSGGGGGVGGGGAPSSSSNQQQAGGAAQQNAPPPTGGASAAGIGAPSGGTGTGTTGTTSSTTSSSFNSKAAKIRRVMMARGRMARGVIVNSRPLIPASAVPEELIAQAQVVLQGKSREVIVRELQRTNLDVNQAVNNLLSRDDDDGDDFDDAADSYMPEDLISLLDTGLHGDQPSVIIDADALYGDDVWGYASIRRRVADKVDKYAESGSSKGPHHSSSTSADNNNANSSNVNASKNAAQSVQNAVTLGNQLEFWTNNENKDSNNETTPPPLRFEKIGGMYSELIAVGSDGRLYQWKWSSAKPENNLHPKSDKLGLLSKNGSGGGSYEKIVSISCSILRCTLLIGKNRLASFVDESLGSDVGFLLDHPVFDLPPRQQNPVSVTGLSGSGTGCGESATTDTFVDVYSSHLVSCARTKSNVVFWWGIMPFNERRKLWEKNKSKSKKYLNYDTNEINVGAQVRMKANPLYQAGSVAFTTVNGYPQLGVLMESAWTLTETCRFQIKDPSSIQLLSTKLNEKSANEGTSDAGDFQLFAKSRKRQASVAFKDDSQVLQQTSQQQQQQHQQPYKEEAWNLADVVFVEDNATAVTGNVVKVDGPYCGVVFPDNDGKVIIDPQKIIANCRLFRKEDLAVVSKSMGSSGQKGPDVFQREPKQIFLPQREKIIDMAVTNSAILTLQSRQGKIIFTKFTYSGRIEEEHLLSSNASVFTSSSAGQSCKKLLNYGEEHILIFLDGNACVYPVCKDSVSGLKQFSFNCLPRLSAVGLGVYPVKNSNISSKKNRITLTVFAFAPTTLIEHITHCDLDSVKKFIIDLEQEKNIDKAQEEILDARLDNNQNILHACVSMAVPPNNKDNVDYNPNLSTTTSASGAGIGTTGGTGGSGATNEVSSLESAAASAARAVYEAKWEQMVTGSRDRVSLDDIMQMAGRPIRWGDVSSQATPPTGGGHASAGMGTAPPYPRFDITSMPPTSWPMEIAADTTIGASAEALLNHDVANIPVPFGGTMGTPSNSGGAVGFSSIASGITVTPRTVSDVRERQQNVHQVLKFLCEHPFLASYLPDLLIAQDQDGLTPFLYAVNRRIYSAALLLWDTAKQLMSSASQSRDDLIQNMLYPPGLANPDNSPLFLLCYNDTCSFTWTGDEHINQDIFECRTCGLVGTLCCCTECAFVCHKNHDCKLKRTSPTAYCDCWEKCKCQALIVGNQTNRFELFNRILNETDLVTKCNRRGEHALLFLVRTVGRQTNEQRQHRMSRSRGPKNTEIEPEMPEHDLDPPRFARKALEKMLTNWPAVKSLLLTGCKDVNHQTPIYDEEYSLLSQDNVTHLDRFSYALVAKCPSDLLDIFLSTLIKEASQQQNNDGSGSNNAAENQKAISRFVRSIVRIFSVLNVAMTPTSNRKKSYSQPILRCRRVFQALITYSIKEVAAAADGILAPARLGFMKSTHPFTLVSSNLDASDIIEKLFAVDPIFDVRSPNTSSSLSHDHRLLSQYGLMMNNLTLTEARDSSRGGGGIGDDDVIPDSQPSAAGSVRGRNRNDDSMSDQDNDSDSDSDYDDHVTTSTAHRGQDGSRRSTNNVSGRHEGGRSSNDHQLMTADGQNEEHIGGRAISSIHVTSNVNSLSQSAAASATMSGGGSARHHHVTGGGSGHQHQHHRHHHRSAAASAAAAQSAADELYYSDNESLESAESLNQRGDDDGGEGEHPSLAGHDEAMTDDEGGGPNQDDLLDYAVGGGAGDLGAEPVSDTDHDDRQPGDDDEDDDGPPPGPPPHPHHHHLGGHLDPDHERDRGDPENDDESEVSDSDDLDGDNTNESDMDHDQVLSGGHHHQASDRFLSTSSLAPPTLRWAMRRAIPREQLAAQNAAHLPPTPPVGGASVGSGIPATSITGQSERGAGGLIFVDSANPSSRRTATYAQLTSAPVLEPSAGAAAGSGLNVIGGSSIMDPTNSGGPSSLCTSSLLARLFGVLVRQLADFLSLSYDYQRLAPNLPRLLTVTKDDAAKLQAIVDRYMKPTWDWLSTLLDSTESQLRFGSALIGSKLGGFFEEGLTGVDRPFTTVAMATGTFSSTGSGGYNSNLAPVSNAAAALYRVFRGGGGSGAIFAGGQADDAHLTAASMNIFSTPGQTGAAVESTSKRTGSSSKTAASEAESLNASARREFLHYTLSLMRSHSDEHGDDLPNIELASLRHVAYVLDAYLYYLMNSRPSATNHNQGFYYGRTAMTSSSLSIGGTMTSSSSASRLYDYRVGDYDAADYVGGGGGCDYFEARSSASVPFLDHDDLNHDDASMDENHAFFKRSESMTYPGLYPLKFPFDYTVNDSMPLVERPHLLQPDATVESYFGVKDEAKAWRNHQSLDKERGQNFSMHLGLSPNVLSIDKDLQQQQQSSFGSSGGGVVGKLFAHARHSSLSPRDPNDDDPLLSNNVVAVEGKSAVSLFGAEPQYLKTPPTRSAAIRPPATEKGAEPDEEEQEGADDVTGKNSPQFSESSPVVEPPFVQRQQQRWTDEQENMDSTMDETNDPENSSSSNTPDSPNKSSSSTNQNQRSHSVIVHASAVVQKTSPPPTSSKKISYQEIPSRLLSKNNLKSTESVGKTTAVPNIDAILSHLADKEFDDQQLCHQKSAAYIIQAHMLMSRWKLCLQVMARAFGDDVGQEQGSVLIQLSGFSVKATRFRKEMERLRNSQGKDLILEVERERNVLLQTSIRQMNQFYGRRPPIGPPIPVHKVKVTFKDEPGEGSGVARAFYTAIAEAFLAQEKLPNLDACQSTLTHQAPVSASSSKMQQQLLNRLRTREREREIQRRRTGTGTGTTGGTGSTGAGTGRRYQLSAEAPPYFPHGEPMISTGNVGGGGTGISGTGTVTGTGSAQPQQQVVVTSSASAAPVIAHMVNWDPSKQALGDRLLPKIRHLHPNLANKITGMLLELPPHQLLMLLASDEALRLHVTEAYDILTISNLTTENLDQPVGFEIVNLPKFTSGGGSSRKSIGGGSSTVTSGKTAAMILDPDELIDNQPLFFEPSNLGFFSPVPGKMSPERLNAFRNVGRVIGLCLLQNELLPLPLCRHVFKFLLGRPINWYDLAFFDKQIFESLRQLANQETAAASIDTDQKTTTTEAPSIVDYGLTFCVNLLPEEGGGTVELKKGGANLAVTSSNLIEYVYRYVDFRLVKLIQKPLEAIRDGVFDVLPPTALEGLTSEDLRLLLCGTPDINVSVLQSYVSFADESSASTDQLSKFKKWFWSVVRKMTPKEKQDLIYFWTGSPALPSSEEGFQPHPNVMIRPADDNHLPTANTCISRLYVPLYSSKQILRQKLLLAIKAKTFGFV